MAQSLTEALAGCLTILEELGRIDGRLQEAVDRRDIPYFIERRVTLLSDYCRWLTRRVSTEFLLILRIHLEQELKRVISPDAYQMFRRLEEVEDAAREMDASADHELMARLREGTLFREVLDQVRLRDVVGFAQRGIVEESSGDQRFS